MPSSRFGTAAAFPGRVIVASYTLLDMLGAPAVSPIARRLTDTGPIAWLKAGARSLPAYGALVALGVPFVIAEPAKIYGLVLIGQGHVVWGVVTIVMAYLVSLVLVDTIFEAARPQLRSIEWFARLCDWASEIRLSVTGYVIASRFYLFLSRLFARA